MEATTITKAAAQLLSLIDKFSYFKGTQDQYMQTYGTHCAKNHTYQETSLSTFCKDIIVNTKCTLDNDISTHVQQVIDNHLQPTCTQHLESLDATILNAILNIEILQQDCIDTLFNLKESTKHN